MQKKYSLNYTFYSDAGHGWLAVPLDEISALGLHHIISPYSYLDENFAYLEEDSDAPKFDKALSLEIGKDEFERVLLSRPLYSPNESPIRRKTRFNLDNFKLLKMRKAERHEQKSK